MTQRPLSSKERALFIAFCVSMVLWNLPLGETLMFPFKLFVTWLHESSHALAMGLTGAGVDSIEIYKDSSGLALAKSSAYPFAKPIIATAGYLGTSLCGGAMICALSSNRSNRICLGLLAILTGLSALLFMGNAFGQWTAASLAAGFGILALQPDSSIHRTGLALVATQSCLHALLDIRVLFSPTLIINGVVVGDSDAKRMAELTFGTALTWALIWIGISVVIFFVALRALSEPKT